MKTTHIIILGASLALCNACSSNRNAMETSAETPQASAVVSAPVNMKGKMLVFTDNAGYSYHLPYTKGNQTEFVSGMRGLSYNRINDKKAECFYMTRAGSWNTLYTLTFSTSDSGTYKSIQGNSDILENPSDYEAEYGTFRIEPIPAGVDGPY